MRWWKILRGWQGQPKTVTSGFIVQYFGYFIGSLIIPNSAKIAQLFIPMILVEKPIGGGGMVFLVVGLVGGFEIHWGAIEPEDGQNGPTFCGNWHWKVKEDSIQRDTVIPEQSIKNSLLNDVMAPECCHFTQDLVQCIVWQHLTVFFVKSRVFLFCCLGMFIPNLQKSHPLNTWKLRHPSSSQLWAAPKTKKRNIWHACNAQKKMSVYTSSWERFQKWWELEPPPFVVQWLHCFVLVPIRQPHLKASCVPAKPSPYAIMWLLCT